MLLVPIVICLYIKIIPIPYCSIGQAVQFLEYSAMTVNIIFQGAQVELLECSRECANLALQEPMKILHLALLVLKL